MKNIKFRIVVGAVIQKGNKILLGYRPKERYPYPDSWHIPGGGINLGEETCEEAVLREIKEETGLEVGNLGKVHWDTGFEPNKHREMTYYTYLVFKGDYISGEVSAGDDLEHFEWVDILDLKNYKLAVPSVALFKHLGYLNL